LRQYAFGSREGLQPDDVLPFCRWEDTNQLSVVSRVEGGDMCLQAERSGLFKWAISDPTTFDGE